MLRSRLDRNFGHYARTGDPRALAVVFDGSAAELYRLGYHLLGDRHAAEDLVQQTFLVAIEQAKAFDGSRRVLPWLCGILTHRALHLRRQLRQRAAAATAGDAVVDPVAEASAREVAATVAVTVRSLAEPYRQVLLLHLVHELEPKDIAEALARPDATVRTQLARGLDLLRKALPVGIAGFAAGCVPPPLGLSTVRAAVLAHAKATVGTAATAGAAAVAFTGVLAMKKVVLVVVAVLVGFGSWHWWGSDPGLPANGDVPGGPAANAATVRAPVTPTPPTEAGGAERVPAPPALDPSTSALEVAVRWHDGTPAADVAVRCRPRPLDFQPWQRTARTGDDGVARFAGLPPVAANVLTGRGASADVELLAGTSQRATITLAPGIDVRGRVVDIEGRGFAGANVWMSVVSNSDDSELVATSAADGTFTIRSAGHSCVVSATAPGFATAKVAWVRMPDLVLTMRAAPGVLVGTVVDPLGRPVADARLLLGMAMAFGGAENGVHRRIVGEVVGQDFWPARFLRTDADGRFRSEGLPPWKWPLCCSAPGHALWWSEVQVLDVGETRITVQLAHGASLRGRVVDEAGVAVAGATVQEAPRLSASDVRISLGMPGSVPPLWRAPPAVTDAQGVYELRQLTPGKHALAAWRETNSARNECELRDGETFVWDAVLGAPSGQPLHGVLVDEHGRSLENWFVRVDGPEPEHRGNRVEVHEGGTFRTNLVPAGAHRLFVEPREPMIGDEVDLGTFDVANCPLRLVVPRDRVPTGLLRGRIVVPASQAAAKCFLWVVGHAERQSRRIPLDPDGGYTAGPLQRGSYRLRVEGSAFGEVPIGRFDVTDGATTDAGTFQVPTPGTLVVTIVDAAGQRLPDAYMGVRPIGDDTDRAGTLAHRDGIARGNLPAGRWLVATGDLSTMAAMEVELRSGETTDVRFVVPAGVPFVLRVPAAVGEFDGMQLWWRTANGVLLRGGRVYMQEAGKDKTLSAPLGSYTLEVADSKGNKASTSFDLRASDPPQVVDLPLPKR